MKHGRYESNIQQGKVGYVRHINFERLLLCLIVLVAAIGTLFLLLLSMSNQLTQDTSDNSNYTSRNAFCQDWIRIKLV